MRPTQGFLVPHTDRLGKLPVTLSTRAGYLAAALLWDDAWALFQSKAPGRELRGALVCVALADDDLRALALQIASSVDYDVGRIGDAIYAAISAEGGDPRTAVDVLLRTCKAEAEARVLAKAQAAPPPAPAAPARREGFAYDPNGAVGGRVPADAKPPPPTAPEPDAGVETASEETPPEGERRG